jgi:hypothetical protein
MDGSPWQNCTPQDLDNAVEAMEKLVMNRLYELYASFRNIFTTRPVQTKFAPQHVPTFVASIAAHY